MNIRWSWMSVLGLLVIDILSGDSIDIAVALIATTILACPICRQHLILKKSPRMAQLSLVDDYNLSTTQETVVSQIIENADFLSAVLSRH